jgi:electron transfer flavoprotein beta subunit
VRLRRLAGGRVRALTVGPLRSSEVLYQAVAKGADDAVRIDADTEDPLIVARLIAAYAREQAFDLVMTGVESRDELASAVAPALAGLLGRPFATSVTALAPVDGGLLIDKELGGGHVQRLALPLPAVVAVQSGICRLTYAPAAKVLQARRLAAASNVQAQALGVQPERARYVEIVAPRRERAVQLLSGPPHEVAVALMDRIERALRG